MPSSSLSGKSPSQWIIHRLNAEAPLERIMDVGPGEGFYAKTCRSPLHNQHWVGVEVWAPYIRKYALPALYDRMIVSDIRYLDWSAVAPLDLVICGDMLEHMTRAEAVKVVDRALATARVVLISMPVEHFPQGELEDNPFEVHVEEDWSDADAKAAFPNWCIAIRESYIGVYLVTRRADDRERLIRLGRELGAMVARDDRAINVCVPGEAPFGRINLPESAPHGNR